MAGVRNDQLYQLRSSGTRRKANVINPHQSFSHKRKASLILGILSVLCVAIMGVQPVPTAYAATDEALDIGFGGQFNDGTNYNSAGEEVMNGALQIVGNASGYQNLDTQGMVLAGASQGLRFVTSNQALALGEANGDATTSFRTEIKATPTAAQQNMATLFSAGGNIFLRYKNASTLEWGFSSNSGGWQNHVAETPAPVLGQVHIFQIEYRHTSGQTAMELFVDGVSRGVASAEGKAAKIGAAGSESLRSTYGFGNEVNAGGLTRGFVGKLGALRVASVDSPWEFGVIDTSTLLHVSFDGTATGGSYAKAGNEIMKGTLTLRQGTQGPANSAVTLTAAQSGVHFVPTADTFTLGTGATIDEPVIAEARLASVTPETMDTIIAIGGNIFLRYKDANTLEYGFSYQNADGAWSDAKHELPAPAASDEHVYALAYIPGDAATRLALSIDGTAQADVTASYKAALHPNPTGIVGFGNEVHPDTNAAQRGLASSLSEVRFARTSADFTADDFVLTPPVPCIVPNDMQPANYIEVSATDCPALVEKKLSMLRPTEKQARYLDMEQIGFMHFNMNTFTGSEWGNGTETPADFNPTNLDTDQWAKAFADAGFKMVMITVKHHDGFMLYDSRYSEHDTGSTPSRVDVFRLFADSMRKHGVGVGIYFSQADSKAERLGIFGNGSQRQTRTIPTLVEDDDRAEKVASGELPTFTYQATDYGAYFLNTLYELLTEYGEIEEVWFDGAQGNTHNVETYDQAEFYDMIQKLQPGAVIANAANDARWVGNEAGWARNAEWSPQVGEIHTNDQGLLGRFALKPGQSTGSYPNLGQFDGHANSVMNQVRSGAVNVAHWIPAEVDVRNTGSWFWNRGVQQRSVSEVVRYYEESTGRNAMLLLNVAPDNTGRFTDRDLAQLQGFAAEIQARYGTPDLALGKPAKLIVGGQERAAGSETAVPSLVDGSNLTGYNSGSRTPIYEVDFGAPTTFQYLVFGENSREAGQQVSGFEVQVQSGDGAWTKIAEAPVIGNRRNVVLNAPVTADKIRLVITSARGPVDISRFEVHARGVSSVLASGVQPKTVYLDTSAATPGTGSKDSPFNSLQQLALAGTLGPGSVIYVKAGTTVVGSQWPSGYGTAELPITIAPYHEGQCYAGGEDFGIRFKDTAEVEDGDALTPEAMLESTGLATAGWRFATSAKPSAVPVFVAQTDMSATASSEYSSARATAAIDGNPSTWWETDWNAATRPNPRFPQHIVLDLGAEYSDLTALHYTPRQNMANSRANEYDVYLSADNTFSEDEKVASGALVNSAQPQAISLGDVPAAGRYIKLVIKSEFGNGETAGAAELNVERAPVAPAAETATLCAAPPTPDDPDTPGGDEPGGDEPGGSEHGDSESGEGEASSGDGHESIVLPGSGDKDDNGTATEPQIARMPDTGNGVWYLIVIVFATIGLGAAMLSHSQRNKAVASPQA
ncbi:MAG: alpha-L-fucosidase [Actinomycetaceae bacterium]|nr:alpha-L-fucosidase [Actinomycetaceae bacterium]MDY5854778.1 alpha-L-fucosidase [Arcanobacterium sp.]